MISLEVENNKLFYDLVTINISIFNGRKLNCNAIGCEGGSIKNHVFTSELKNLDTIALNCYVNGENETEECVSLVERELISRLNITSHELNDLYHEKSGEEDNYLSKQYSSIVIYKDNEQLFQLGEIEQIPYIKFTAVVKKDKNDIGILLNGLDKNNKQVSWLKEIISTSSKIIIKFSQ